MRKETDECGLDESLVQRLIRSFRALCDTNRLNLLTRLACCPSTLNVRSMAGCCPLDQSVVSRHLAAMREAGIVTAERKGKEVHYAVNASGFADLLRTFADAIEGRRPGRAPQKKKTNKTKRRTP
jgi:DNA-binding transcriptional ArsR family regulator